MVILLSDNRLVRPNKISLPDTDESCLGVGFSLGTLESMKNKRKIKEKKDVTLTLSEVDWPAL